VIPCGARRARLARVTEHPDGAWTTPAARNFLMDVGQRTATARFLIRDRAGQFTGSFDAVFTAEGTSILASPPQAPRASAICERITTSRCHLPLCWAHGNGTGENAWIIGECANDVSGPRFPAPYR
jgi:hypothetical protein